MADAKISALTALTGASVDTAADVLAIVDTSTTTTKKILIDELRIALGIADAAATLIGTSTTSFLTPGGFAGNKDLVGAAGFYKFPGGLIIQWDSVATDGAGDAVWTYPTAFASAVFFVGGIVKDGDLNRLVNVGSVGLTTSNIYTTTAHLNSGVSTTPYVLAIGI